MRETFHSERSAAEIFDYIVDFSRITEWDHTIVSARKTTPGSVGLASRFDLVYSMGLRKSEISYEIQEFSPPSKAVLVGKSNSFTAIDTVTIAEEKSGCEVTWNADIEFTGAAAMLVPLIEKRVVAAGIQTIRNLAAALEDNFSVPELRPWQKLADKLVLPGVLSFSKFGHRAGENHWKPVTANIKNKHIVITGATSGLGLASAQELAQRGASLTLVARDQKKASKILKDIQCQSGNDSIDVEIADLEQMQQVTMLSQRLLKKGRAIDVLINNAGALINPRRETVEGLEASFALLLLGPYLLTERLHPLLKKAKAARVINVSSGGMYATSLSLGNLQSNKGDYRGSDAYARSKRGLVIMGERWAESWANDGITVHNMHPGWAQTPGVEESLPQFARITRRILRTPEEGADTIVWLAHATEVAKTSGLFWLDRTPHSTHLSNRTRETEEQRDALESALIEFSERFGVES